jgi:hypothetical protein
MEFEIVASWGAAVLRPYMNAAGIWQDAGATESSQGETRSFAALC